MKILEKLIKGKKGDQVAVAVDGIIDLEERVKKLQGAYEDARARFHEVLGGDVLSNRKSEHPDEMQQMVYAESRYDTAKKMLEDAKKEAAAIIASKRAECKEQIKAVETEILELRKRKDRNRLKDLIDMMRQYGLEWDAWPSKDSAGKVVVPATVLPPEELKEMLTMTGERAADPVDAEIGKLNARRLELLLIERNDPEAALEGLVQKARSTGC
jgi:hypothetical protein